jgi:hypothetical protein
MKKTIISVLTAAMFVFFGALPARAGDAQDSKLIFTEIGVSYGSVIEPDYIANSSTGVFDTAVFDIKAGVNIFKWADIYAGASFNYFMKSSDWNQNYTFYPLFGGVRANIMPEWCVYPSVALEYGAVIASAHVMAGPDMTEQPWVGTYYNFALAANWEIADIAVLRLSIERPSVTDKNGSEIHIFKTGLAWKIFY